MFYSIFLMYVCVSCFRTIAADIPSAEGSHQHPGPLRCSLQARGDHCRSAFTLSLLTAVLWNRNDLLWFRFRQHSFLNTQNSLQNLAFSMSEAALFPRQLASHFFMF